MRLHPALLVSCILALWQQRVAADLSSPVVALTPDNYDKLTDGKNLFVKLFAPWCGHCQAMASDWERLAYDFKDHKTVLIAEIDCSTEKKNEIWCTKAFEIEGFPTILYGDPSDGGVYLEEYDDEREYDTLSAFASETLTKAPCTPKNTETCSPEEKERIESFWKLSLEEIDELIEEKETKIEALEDELEEDFERLQGQYDELADVQQALSHDVKHNIKVFRDILAQKKKS